MVDRSKVFWLSRQPSPSEPETPELRLKSQNCAWILGSQLFEAIQEMIGCNEVLA
jgi:hypothetical protein